MKDKNEQNIATCKQGVHKYTPLLNKTVVLRGCYRDRRFIVFAVCEWCGKTVGEEESAMD